MDNEGCGKIAAIVTIIAGLIAIFVFVTGKQNLPQVVQENRSETVQVSFTATPTIAQVIQPTTAPTRVPPTAVPQPTLIPTPVPPPSALPDTATGTILEVGQTWRASGLELTLTNTQLDNGSDFYHVGRGMHVCLRLANRRPQDLAIRYDPGNFVSQDNSGRRLRTMACMYDCADYWREMTPIIRSGQSINLGLLQSDTGECLYVEVDTTNPPITGVTLTVTGISSINNARWRIPIYH